MREYHGKLIEQLLKLINANKPQDGSSIVAGQVKEFIDEIPGGFLIYRADGNEDILYANKALVNIFKCETFEEFLEHTGGSFKGIVHPEDLDEVEKSIVEQIAASPDDMDYVEYRIICKDGEIRCVEDYGHFAHTEFAGDIFYVFISDATEKINRRLQERIQRLEIIEGLAVDYESILYFNLENDTVLPYRLSSRMKKHFDGILQVRKYKEMIANYIDTWVHPEDKASVSESLTPDNMCRKLADCPTFYFYYRCIQDEKIKHLQLRIANVSKNGDVNKFVLGFKCVDDEILQEIKKKQILEAALEAANLADVAKNTFLSNMSHDMRTPLNAVFGFIALARKNISNPDEAEYYLNRIEEVGNQLLDLTAKVLEVTDTKTQDLLVKESECDICDILDEIYEATQAQANKKNLQVTLNTDGIEHSKVVTDALKIKSILTHLTENAVQYNVNDGKIEIIATEKAHGDNKSGAYSFTVKDTGIGISPSILDKIFVPFERENNTTASGISGGGLGLTIAKRDAEMLGGNILVESVKGSGSTFTLTLNLKIKDFDDKSRKKIKKTDLKGVRILLVEDNEINLEIETDILTDEGFIIDTAENGQIAVEKIKNSPPDTYDIVLMDIQMPIMDGRQASAEIRQLDGIRAQIPVIALSANALERDKRLSIEYGMNAHLVKPMDIEAIKKTIAEVLSNKRK